MQAKKRQEVKRVRRHSLAAGWAQQGRRQRLLVEIRACWGTECRPDASS
jgi:hypothetical protein